MATSVTMFESVEPTRRTSSDPVPTGWSASVAVNEPLTPDATVVHPPPAYRASMSYVPVGRIPAIEMSPSVSDFRCVVAYWVGVVSAKSSLSHWGTI